MACFAEASYWYSRQFASKNSWLFRKTINSNWRHIIPINYGSMNYKMHPIKQTRGYCLACCNYDELFPCKCCHLKHVCHKCYNFHDCFLNLWTTQLRVRTLRVKTGDKLAKSHLQTIVDFLLDSFPITDKIVKRSMKKINQQKCRTKFEEFWYSHLTLPITLGAMSLNLGMYTYYIFGYYDAFHLNKTQNYPFKFINFSDDYDKLLLDSINFQRMECLPYELQSMYAKNYFSQSRALSRPTITPFLSHFAPATYMRNVTRKFLRCHDSLALKTEWNELYYKYLDSKNKKILRAVMRSEETKWCKCTDISKLTFSKYWNDMIANLNVNKITSKHDYFNFVTNVGCFNCDHDDDMNWHNHVVKMTINDVADVLRAIFYKYDKAHCSSVERYKQDILEYLQFENITKLDVFTTLVKGMCVVQWDEYILLRISKLSSNNVVFLELEEHADFDIYYRIIDVHAMIVKVFKRLLDYAQMRDFPASTDPYYDARMWTDTDEEWLSEMQEMMDIDLQISD
nr:NSP1 [Rotavirus A]